MRWSSNYLYNVGLAVLINRIVIQYSVGIVDISKDNNRWNINVVPGTEFQLLDSYDQILRKKMEAGPIENRKKFFEKWNVVVDGNFDEVLKKYSNAMQINTDEASPYDPELIYKMMKEGILLYPVSFGNLLRYHAEDEVVIHMLNISVHMAKRWMRDAGIDVESSFNGVSFLDILIVVSIIIAMHIRHGVYLHYSLDRKDINIPCSITIWSSFDDIFNEINLILKMDKNTVRKILDIISLNNTTFESVSKNEDFYMPLLIEIGNELYVRPISSLSVNPFFYIRKYLFDRHRDAYNNVVSKREKIFRDDIYYMFKGNRYQCIESNVKIKNSSGSILTDIDAAVFDVVDNSLALFQLKWQDFDTNNTLALRSKSKNLVFEIDNWGLKLDTWLQDVDIETIKRTFQIKSKSKKIIIYLFAVSRGFSKTESFGFSSELSKLAITTYSYFQRIRGEIGPNQPIFPMIHRKIKEDRAELEQIYPKPTSFTIDNNSFNLERYWFSLPDELYPE